jgi:uncharacterized membrane protein
VFVFFRHHLLVRDGIMAAAVLMERIHEWNLVRMPFAVSLSTLTQDTLSSVVKLTAKYRLRRMEIFEFGRTLA